jgi:hypothetical protein
VQSLGEIGRSLSIDDTKLPTCATGCVVREVLRARVTRAGAATDRRRPP